MLLSSIEYFSLTLVRMQPGRERVGGKDALPTIFFPLTSTKVKLSQLSEF